MNEGQWLGGVVDNRYEMMMRMIADKSGVQKIRCGSPKIDVVHRRESWWYKKVWLVEIKQEGMILRMGHEFFKRVWFQGE